MDRGVKLRAVFGMLLGVGFALSAALGDSGLATPVVPVPSRPAVKPLVLAHFMPWFQAPKVSKSFGWHWHMGFFDPYEADAQGKRPIATHDYPLTGPYDSADPAVIEYQLTLMKLSGIDGVILDWYGIDDALDYKKIHENSRAIVAAIEKAGMKFAVCYEDQSLAKMIQARKFDYEESLGRGQATLRWLAANWFRSPAYVTIEGRPLLLDFGPQHFLRADQWDQVFLGLSPRPYFVALNDHMEFYADAVYPWPPMERSGGRELSFDQVADYFSEFYAKTADRPHLFTTVFPGFHDIYEQAHVASSYGYLDDHGGETFRVLLEAASRARPDVIQIATWNDYGEGTVVEPNEVRGYGPLETLQKMVGARPGFHYTAEDLRIPLKVWALRQSKTPPPDLSSVAEAVFADDEAAFRAAVVRLHL